MNLARQFPDRRALFGGSGASHLIVAAVCPLNMFGGGASHAATTTTDDRVAASEGSLAVGGGSKFLEPDSIDLEGSVGAELGTKLNAGENITINSEDVLKAAIEGANEQAKSVVEALRDQSLTNTSAFSAFAKQSNESKAEDLASALRALGDLKQSTDEQAQNRKTFLYLMLGVLAVLGVLFFPWRKIQ